MRAGARTSAWLIAARAAQGAGSALLVPLGLALLSAAFPPERRGAAIGIFSAITGLAVASGPLIGGAVVQGSGVAVDLLDQRPHRAGRDPARAHEDAESHGTDTSLDIRGLALVTGGVLGLVWALVRGNEAGWGSPEVIGSLVLGAVLIAAFVAWELRAQRADVADGLLPLARLLGGQRGDLPHVRFTVRAVFFYAQLLQTGLGYDPLGAGLRLMPWTATFITVAPIVGALVDKVGERPFMVAGLSLQAAGLAWLALIAEPGMAYSQMLAPFIVGGVGVSMAIPAAQNSVLGSMADSALGKAAGANSMMRELGGVFGVAVVVAVFAGAGSYASPQAFTDGFEPAILVAAGLALIGALAGLALPGRRAVAAPLVRRVQEATS